MRYYRFCMIMVGALMAMGCQESLEDRCAREAKEYTEKHCPMMVEKNIVMDSMTFDKSSHVISYVYTLKNELDDTAVVNGSKSKGLLLEQVRNSANLKLYKDEGYGFRYVYFSQKNKGQKLLDVTFKEKDYK